MTGKLLIVGMGGHGKVVADVARRLGYEIVGYLDDARPLHDASEYLGRVDDFAHWLDQDVQFFIAIGNNLIRQKIATRLALDESRYATLIDPSAIIGSDVRVMPGTVVMPGVIVNAASTIGAHSILNTAATVDHDCKIDEFVHISPGVHLAGGVTVGQQAHVGIGASVIPLIKIGHKSIIGAGAAVIRDLPNDVVAVGVPAKVIKNLTAGEQVEV